MLMHPRFIFPLIIFHIIFGVVVKFFPVIGKGYCLLLLFFAIIKILQGRNAKGEAAFFAVYIVGLEMAMRMTAASPVYEFSKYSLIIILGLAVLAEKTRKSHHLFFIAFLLYLPAIVLSDGGAVGIPTRQLAAFNLAGPISLVVTGYYFYNRKITLNYWKKMLRIYVIAVSSAPIIVVMYLYTNPVEQYFTSSIWGLSGGFGPNQVSTAFASTALICFAVPLLGQSIFGRKIYDWCVGTIFIAFSLLTFSRGGPLSVLISLLAGLFVFQIISPKVNGRNVKAIISCIVIFVFSLASWGVVNQYTDGFLVKRYEKGLHPSKAVDGSQVFTGRLAFISADFDGFVDSFPNGLGVGMSSLLHVGVGQSGQRYVASSHTEFSRLLAEHGLLGLFILAILIFLPIQRGVQLKSKENQVLLVMFVTFSFLTMFHSAMRLALNGLFYGMALMSFSTDPEDSEEILATAHDDAADTATLE